MRRILAGLLLAAAVTACGESPEPKREQTPENAAIPGNADIDVSQQAQQVQIGMSEGEVIRILGTPRARVEDGTGQRLTFWNFDRQQRVRSRVYVTLDKEGKVIDVEAI